MAKRSSLRQVLLCVAVSWTVAGAVAQSPPAATIVIPVDATDQRKGSAQLLQTYIEQSIGLRLPIGPRPGEGVALHVGRSPYVDAQNLGLAQADPDGFVLRWLDDHNYVIAGGDEWGTEFAVCEFLERALGVRWLLPGALGTDVPRQTTLVLPRSEVRAAPAYLSRWISGLESRSEVEWAQRLRAHRRVEMHHNLRHMFPPSRYAVARPEFYPVYDGRRYIPKGEEDGNWQPNFTADGLVEAAAAIITRYFRDNPDAASYSLGINDCTRFDETMLAEEPRAGRLNYLGWQDASDPYYRWCNGVAERVAVRYPDKYLGCLAYVNVAEPPTDLRLHPCLFPFQVCERLMWCDPVLARRDQDMVQRWEKAAAQLGWCDYVYGSPYCLPRAYPHKMAEYLRWGRAHGVRAVYAEAYPNWAEGPRLYVYLKLLWDPDSDVDALLSDWYARCVGARAAPFLRDYYALWERFWTEAVPRCDWWPKRPTTYLPFDRPGYLAAVDENDLRRSRELLDQCVERAETPAQRQRAALLRDGFAYYEASALAFRGDLIARTHWLSSESDALAAVEDAARRLSLAERRRALAGSSPKEPLLKMPLSPERYPALRGDDWSLGLLWSLYDWGLRSAAVRERITGLAHHESAHVRAAGQRLARLLVAGAGELLSADASLEREPWAPWFTDIKQNVGTMRPAEGHARTGKRSVRCIGVRDGRLHQFVPVRAGHYVAIGYAYVPDGQPQSGTVKLTAIRCGEGERQFDSPATELKLAPGQWMAIACPVDVPEKIDGQPIVRLLLSVYVSGCEHAELYLDDVGLYRFPD